MQKPSERHKLTSDNNIIKFKKPVHDPFKCKKYYCPNVFLNTALVNIRANFWLTLQGAPNDILDFEHLYNLCTFYLFF